MTTTEHSLKDLLANPATTPFSRLKYIARYAEEEEVARFLSGLFIAAAEAKDLEEWDRLRQYLEEWEDWAVARLAARMAPAVDGPAPWATLRLPVHRAKFALVTTGGVYVEGQQPFEENEWHFREIPADTPRHLFRVRHWGYDISGPQEDINCVFPLDRFKELQAEGRIGSLAATHYSFMGLIRQPEHLIEESAPEVARRLEADGVQAVFLAST